MGSDDSYTVNLEQLDEAITTMAKFGQDVEDWLGDVDRHIADLHLSWSSQAATVQRAAHGAWMAGAAQMRENLGELREVAKTAHKNYSAAIETNTTMWP